MTLVDAVARVRELQGLGSTAAPAAAASSPATSFASTLAQASSAAPATSNPYSAQIDAAATANGIDPSLLTGLVEQESGFNPSARSGAGAVGLTQLMPSTAASLGVTDPTDPVQSLAGGARYLRQQLDRFGGDPRLALAAYNAGPGAVERAGGVPPYPETQRYVTAVLDRASAARGS